MSASLDEIERVYRTEFGRYVRVATAITGDEHAAVDAVQDAFANAIRQRWGYRRRGPLEAWLWRIVVNSARAVRRPAEETTGAEPEPFTAPAEADPELHAAITALPDRQRLALFLHYYADLAYEDIARVLGISTGTVGATLNIARAAVRARLEEAVR
jgi:RNA polymerase sigma factor (sigma-70 family)